MRMRCQPVVECERSLPSCAWHEQLCFACLSIVVRRGPVPSLCSLRPNRKTRATSQSHTKMRKSHLSPRMSSSRRPIEALSFSLTIFLRAIKPSSFQV